ncbi:MAG: hypothetical protein L0Z62_01555 [Gemmataceae bacterium]|nr:hypothetical protein [Gemmataceae bacterium]
MSLEECGPDDRQRLIDLLEADDWRVCESVLKSRHPLLRGYVNQAGESHLGECAVIEFILDRLRSNFPMHPVTLGSGETACVMNNADGHGLYIKVKIENEEVRVLSFDVSDHYKGN